MERVSTSTSATVPGKAPEMVLATVSATQSEVCHHRMLEDASRWTSDVGTSEQVWQWNGVDEDVGNGVGEFSEMVWATASVTQQSAVLAVGCSKTSVVTVGRQTSDVGSRFGNGILKVTSDLQEQTRTQLTGHLTMQMKKIDNSGPIHHLRARER